MTRIAFSCALLAFGVMFSNAYNIHINNNCNFDATLGPDCSGSLAAGASTDCELSYMASISIQNDDAVSVAEFIFAPMTQYQFYDVNYMKGFNVGIEIVPGNGSCHVIDCADADCTDAIRRDADYENLRYRCSGSEGYAVTFCP